MPEARLAQGLQALGLALSEDRRRRLLAYVALLTKWNRTYNLTAVRDPGEMVTRHVLDSLAVVPWLHGSRILDVGSGAGLPGIPLAVACPERRFVLLDAGGKKVRFLRQAVLELALDNTEAVQARIEDFQPDRPFDTVISRAWSSLAELQRQGRRLCGPGGRVLAMKGAYPVAEVEALDEPAALERVVPLSVPGLDAQRHLVVLRAA